MVETTATTYQTGFIPEDKLSSERCSSPSQINKRNTPLESFRKSIQVPKMSDMVSSIVAEQLVANINPILENASSQKIDSDWKVHLFQALGGSDSDVIQKVSMTTKSHLDTLLSYSRSEQFDKICLEHDIPCVLIKCLCLLRVIELQNSEQYKNHNDTNKNSTRDQEDFASPITTVATAKILSFLCLLCSNSTVGNHMRPQLADLLSLSGAPYPPCGEHIATIASTIITNVADSCLSPELIEYIYKQKMVFNMLTDIENILLQDCNKYPRQNDRASDNLLTAFMALVHLVVRSCNHKCFHLLRQFRSANGYQILYEAIMRSCKSNLPKFMDLASMLVLCKTGKTVPTSFTEIQSKSANNVEIYHPWNKDACLLVEDIMFNNIPVLNSFIKYTGGIKPSFHDDNEIKTPVSFAVDFSLIHRKKASPSRSTVTIMENQSDLQSYLFCQLLDLMTKWLSLEPRNFVCVEKQYSFIAYFILAYPTFEDELIRTKILELLHLVKTWMEQSDDNFVTPFSMGCEIYLELIKKLRATYEINSDEDFEFAGMSLQKSDKSRQGLSLDARRLFAVLEGFWKNTSSKRTKYNIFADIMTKKYVSYQISCGSI